MNSSTWFYIFAGGLLFLLLISLLLSISTDLKRRKYVSLVERERILAMKALRDKAQYEAQAAKEALEHQRWLLRRERQLG